MQMDSAPGGLAEIPAGPALAAALGPLAVGSVPNDRLLDVLAAQYRQLCHEQARMAAVLTEVGRCEGLPEPGKVDRLDAPGQYCAEETRAALRWTRRAAENEHDLAETVVHKMPSLFDAWLAGALDRQRVSVFDRYLTGLDRSRTDRICAVAVPRAHKLTTGQLAVLLRKMVIAVDPDAAARWYRTGIRDRDVTAYLADDGTVTISANGLPADEAEAACTRLQNLADAARRAGHPGRIGQIRSDLHLGMLDGRFHHMHAEQIIATLIAEYRPTGTADVILAGDNRAQDDDAGGDDDSPGPSAHQPPPGGPDPDGPPDAGARNDGEDSGEEESAQRGSAEAGSGEACSDGADSGDGADCGDGTDSDDPSPGGAGADPAHPCTGPGAGPDPAFPVPDERVGIEVRVALGTLLALDDHPGEIPGLGVLPAHATRARVALQSRAEWRFAVTDSDGTLVSEGRTRRRPTGMRRDGPPGGIVELHIPAALLDDLLADPARYPEWAAVVADIAAQHARRDTHLADLDTRPDARLPGAALRRHTEIRDRTCTFAGVCRHRAHASDTDHSRDHHHGGPTVRANLGPLCGHDHDVKHRAGWTVEQPEPGTFVWRSPLGGRYTSRGEYVTPEMPDPVDLDPAELDTADQDPGPDACMPGREYPILQRPPPVRPAPTPPPAPEQPDDPPF